MAKSFRCPNCNPTKIQNNGLRLTDHDLTLLCVARVDPGAAAFSGEANPPLEVGADGKVDCGQQWCPNTGV